MIIGLGELMWERLIFKKKGFLNEVWNKGVFNLFDFN